ncbi:MAG: SUMF1/EgtB/PvdO family nonheme iron enzyme [Phycisphaerae bacterium]|nr:SUMF1/EgtB/PvdO family nonheme iron enzyme [Saprospiraceae bacterium]
MRTLHLYFSALLLATAGFLPSNLNAQRSGKDYAVFFYVTDFKPGWAKLPETANEATLLQTELQTNFGFKCEAVANPTKAQMREKLREYNAKLAANDQVMFFFSMHGHYDPGVRDRGYLVGKDGLVDDPYRDTWLSYDDLRSDLAVCKARHILLALDACHSGSFGIRNKSRPDAPTYNQEADCAEKIKRTMQFVGRQYCSSGNKEAKTPAKSLFASRFLEALRKGDDEGILYFDDLEYWLNKVEVPEPECGAFSGHEPGGDFVFVRKNACGVAPPDVTNTDRDGDRIPDSRDECPNEYGAHSSGCPDSDEDDIPDKDDQCPYEKGTLANHGCPSPNSPADRDADGVPDAGDQCPDKKGEKRYAGCPDTDGDGVPDHKDKCVNEKGLAGKEGCPGLAATQLPESSELSGSLLPPEPFRNRKSGLEMVFVERGEYTMGSPSSEKDRNGDECQHSVTVSSFNIAKYEVTQADWQEVMGNNPSHFNKENCLECPVEQVSWNDVQEFLKKLNARFPNRNYRLPTEEEWEYAARGGKKSKGYLYSGDNLVGNVARYTNNSIRETYPVGGRKANELGVYDMSGNVREWCEETYEPYLGCSGTANNNVRMLRGGSWADHSVYCQVASRNWYYPNARVNNIGFRVVRGY